MGFFDIVFNFAWKEFQRARFYLLTKCWLFISSFLAWLIVYFCIFVDASSHSHGNPLNNSLIHSPTLHAYLCLINFPDGEAVDSVCRCSFSLYCTVISWFSPFGGVKTPACLADWLGLERKENRQTANLGIHSNEKNIKKDFSFFGLFINTCSATWALCLI